MSKTFISLSFFSFLFFFFFFFFVFVFVFVFVLIQQNRKRRPVEALEKKETTKQTGTFALIKQSYCKEKTKNRWNGRKKEGASDITETNLHHRGSTACKQDERATTPINEVITPISISRKPKNYEKNLE